MPSALTMTAGDWLLLVVLSVLWGASFLFAEIALREIPPFTLALGRVGIAAALLLAYVKALRIPMPRGFAAWRSLALLSLINNVFPFTLIFWSQTHITSGLASILNATTPLFTIVIAHLLTHDDKITPSRMLGLIVGFGGVVVMIGPEVVYDLGVNVAAQLASLLAALFYAVSGVYGRRFKNEAPAAIAAGLLVLSTLILIPLSALIDRPWALSAPSIDAVASMVALAAISTAAAYLIYFRVLARAGATNLLLVTFLIPVSAILFGVTLLDETLEPRQLIGMAAIAVGLAAIDGRPHRMLLQAVRKVASQSSQIP